MMGEGMRYFRIAPDPRLNPWIKCYWWVEPDPRSQPASAPDLLLPDGHSELVFRFAGEFSRWQLGDAARRARMNQSYVIGGRARSVLTHSPGGLRMAGVKLDPRALRALLGRPLGDFRDNTVTLADLECRALSQLEAQLAELESVDTMPGLFDRFFLRHLPGELRDDAATELLLRRIRLTRGAQPILKWAREQRLDARTLERRFVARVGMTPKQFARIERFKQSYYCLTTRGAAYLDGYYDESHFDREFRQFMGASPLAWFKRQPGYTAVISNHLLERELGGPRRGS